MLGKDIEKIGVLPPKIRLRPDQQLSHLLFRERLDARPMISRIRFTSPGLNSREMTRLDPGSDQRQSRDGNAHRWLRADEARQ